MALVCIVHFYYTLGKKGFWWRLGLVRLAENLMLSKKGAVIWSEINFQEGTTQRRRWLVADRNRSGTVWGRSKSGIPDWNTTSSWYLERVQVADDIGMIESRQDQRLLAGAAALLDVVDDHLLEDAEGRGADGGVATPYLVDGAEGAAAQPFAPHVFVHDTATPHTRRPADALVLRRHRASPRQRWIDRLPWERIDSPLVVGGWEVENSVKNTRKWCWFPQLK